MASLGNDLALIRKKQDLSLDDIQKATKIPKRILRSIEDDSIFTDFKENSTYIRSYVRGYAKALSIDDKQIIHALDKREINDYSGSLQKVAGIEPASTSETEDEEKPRKQDTPDRETDDQENDITPDQASDFQSEEEKKPPQSFEKRSQTTTPDAAERSEINSIDWAKKGRQFQPLKTRKSKLGFGILILIIAISGGLFFYYFAGDSGSADSSGGDDSQQAEPSLTTDSLELNISSSTESDTVAEETLPTETDTTPELQNESLDALPDTLDMIIYAAHGTLEPVRVYTDIAENINPYWIEEGEAMRFRFVNEIRIRGEYDNFVLIMNGHVVQNFEEQFYNPDTRLLEINRSYFEGDSRWLQPAPDSLEIDAPAPSVIHERPTFN